jgi:hypothetical protein
MRKSRKKIIVDEGLQLAIKQAGSRYKLAKMLQIDLSGLTRWKRIPSGRIIQLEKLLGIDRSRLRPDLYR